MAHNRPTLGSRRLFRGTIRGWFTEGAGGYSLRLGALAA